MEEEENENPKKILQEPVGFADQYKIEKSDEKDYLDKYHQQMRLSRASSSKPKI